MTDKITAKIEADIKEHGLGTLHSEGNTDWQVKFEVS